MPRGYTTRKLQVFAIHGHYENAERQFDYEAVFSAIAAVRRARRGVQIGDKSVAIPQMTVTGGRMRLTAYEGEEGNPLFYNFADATERIERLEGGEMLATKTHVLADLTRREAIVEYNQRGAKAADIAATLEHVARVHANLGAVKIVFTPIADAQFLQAIDRFRRVRVASLKMARPNQDWTRHADNFLAMADDSDAHYVEIGMIAERQESLSQDRGIMSFIRRLAAERLPFLKTATITGIREGEEAETSVSLANHVEHQRIPVRMTEDGHVDDSDIERKMDRYMRERTGTE